MQWDIQGKHGTCRKLGILGGTFEDGSLSIFIVPDPEDVQEDETSQKDKPRSLGQDANKAL